MLNVEKYPEDIKNEMCNGDVETKPKPCIIAKVSGIGCNRICETCTETSIKWLFSKYEPPLLKNGDNLKTGDWLMVRNSEATDWKKRQFLFYYDHIFYCAYFDEKISGDVTIIGWSQARLPMEGE